MNDIRLDDIEMQQVLHSVENNTKGIEGVGKVLEKHKMPEELLESLRAGIGSKQRGIG